MLVESWTLRWIFNWALFGMLLAMVACGEQEQPPEEASADETTQVSSYRGRVGTTTSASQQFQNTVESNRRDYSSEFPDLQVAETFSIITPSEFVNQATFEASWSIPKDVRDYDVILSPFAGCPVGAMLQFAADYQNQVWTIEDLNEGTYYLCVQAILWGGKQIDATNSPLAFTVDLTPPEEFSAAELVSPTADATPSVIWNPSQGADYYKVVVGRDEACTLEVQSYSDIQETVLNMQPIADGVYYVCITAWDLAGNNTAAQPAFLPLVVDTTPPTPIGLTTSTETGSYGIGNEITLTLSFDEQILLSDDQRNLVLKLNSGGEAHFASIAETSIDFTYSVAAGENSLDLGLLTDAANLLFNASTLADQLGNRHPTELTLTESWLSDAHNLRIDTNPPESSFRQIPDALHFSDQADFEVSCTDLPCSYEWSIDGSNFSPGEATYSLSALGDGEHTVFVRSIDQAANIESPPSFYTFQVDLYQPTTSITSSPAAQIAVDSATFAFGCSEANCTFYTRMDGGEWTVQATPLVFSALPDGSHTFEVYSVDSIGRTDATPASFTFVVDTQPPEAQIDAGPSTAINATNANFTLSCTDEPCTYTYQLDGGSVENVAGNSIALTGLSEASHTIAITAIDALANIQETPTSFTFEVDLTDPDTNIDSQPDAITGDTTATFTASCSDSPCTYEGQLDGGGWAGISIPHVISGLSHGNHTFEIRAADAAGNVDPSVASFSWDVDTMPADTSIDAQPASLIAVDAATFEFSCNDAPCTFEYSFDDANYSTAVSPLNLTSLADGNLTFYVRSIDAQGNTDQSSASFSFEVDTTPPEVVLAASPAAAINATNATFDLSCDDEPCTYEANLNSGGWGVAADPYVLTGLAEADHTVSFRATDAAGNVGVSLNTVNWKVDLTDPDTSISTQPTDPTRAAAPAFIFSCDDAPCTYEVSLDGGGYSAIGSDSYAWTGAAEGSRTLAVRATDAAGNVDGSSASYTFEVDQSEPETSIDSQPGSVVNLTSANFSFSCDDLPCTFEARLDGAPFAVVTSPVNLTSLGEGNHTYDIRAIDAAGNIDSSPASYTWEVDLTTPTTSLVAQPDLSTQDTNANFDLNCDDLPCTYEARLNGGAWGAAADPYGLTGLAEQDHLIEFRATDAATNVESPVFSFNWEVDQTPPETNITAQPADPFNDPTPDFEFTCDDAPCTYEIRIDGGGWSFVTSPHTLGSVLSDGNHTVELRASDGATNQDASPASYTWEVDTTEPNTSIDTFPATLTNDATPQFIASCDDTPCSFEAQLNSDGWNSVAANHNAATIADGSHTYAIRSTDAAGNVDSTPATYSLTVDTTPPTASLDVTPSSPSNQTNATFEFSCNEPPCSFEGQLSGGGWGAVTSPHTLTGLTEGFHNFEVRAIDQATNVGSSVFFNLEVDLTDPDTAIDSSPASETNQTTVNFEFSCNDTPCTFEGQLDGGGWSSITTPHELSSLSEASYVYEIRATDAAGNTDPTPSSHNFAVDLTEPNTSASTVPADPNNDPTPTFDPDCDDAPCTYEGRVNGGSWEAVADPHDLAALADGTHTYEIRGTDAAGNVDSTPYSHTWEIDTVPPDTTINSFPPALTQNTFASFTASCDDVSPCTFEAQLNGGGWASITLPYSINSLADNSYTLEIRAIDAAGNPDPSPDSYSWEVDTTPPTASFSVQPADPTNATAASFTLSCDDLPCSYQAQLDGASYASVTSTPTLNSLNEGSRTYYVLATDAAGNIQSVASNYTWEIDLTDPDTSQTSIPADPTNDPTPDFGFTCDDLPCTFEGNLNGGGWSAITSVHTLSSLAEGSHTFQIRSTDAAGNTDSSAYLLTFEVDTTAPETSMDSQPADPLNSTSATFTFSCDDTPCTFEGRLDGGVWGAITSPHNITGLSQGSRTFEIRATDAAGNTDATPIAHTWEVDTVAPQTSIDSQPADPINSVSAIFAFSCDDTPCTFEGRLDGGSWSAITSPHNLSSLSVGARTFEIRATDAAGNTDASPASYTWEIDQTAPQTVIDSQPSDPDNATGPSFSFSCDDLPCTFEGRLDGGSWSSITSPHALSGLSAGSRTFEIRATDAAGNTDASPASYTWELDTTEPQTSIDSQPTDPVGSTSATFTFSCDDTPCTFEGRLDGGVWGAITTPLNLTSLSEGSRTYEIRATDAAGNVDASPASYTWEIDTSAPNTNITSNPSDPSSDTGPSMEFSCDDTPCTFEVQLDGGGWSAQSSPYALSGLSDASHTFEVRATDASGNLDASPASFTWTVDTDPPDTTIDTFPSNPSNTDGPTFEFSCDEASCTFQGRLDGGPWGTIVSPLNLSGLSEGSRTYDIRAIDGALNTDSTPASYTWEVDTIAPDTTYSSEPAANINVTNATFEFSCDDTPCTFEGRLDGGSWGGVTSPVNLTGLSEASHTYEVRATDAAGNTEVSFATSNFEVDQSPPDTTVSAAPAAFTSSSNATFEFACDDTPCTFEGRMNGGSWSSITSPHNFTFLSEGSYTFEIRATDAAGNVDASPSSDSWEVDQSEPNTTIDSAPANPDASSGPSFSFSCDDTPCTFEGNLDGGGWSSITSPHNLSSLSQGSHTLQIRATDAAGNTDSSVASHTWEVDTVPPNTTIDTSPSDPTNNNSPSIEFSCDDTPCTFEGNLDGGGWSTVTSPHSLSSLSEGSHTFQVRGLDAANNTDASPASVTFTVDTIRPDTTIDSAPAANTQSTSATFDVSCNEASCTYEGRLDGGAWGAISDPENLSGLSEASHTYEIRATDQAGNVETGVASHTWEIDQTPPNTSIDSQPVDPVNNTSSTFSFSCDDTPCTFEYQLNSGGWASATSPHNFTVSAGSNTYEIRGIDAASNTDASPASYTWFLDATDPTVGGGGTLTLTAASTTSVQVDWSKATDNHSDQTALQYVVYYSTSNNISNVNDAKANGTIFGSYTTDIATSTVTGLTSDVVYYFTTLVLDEAGNEAAYTSNSERTQTLPMTVSGLEAWYDANEVSGSDDDEILTVSDRSSNSNDATAPGAGNGPNLKINIVNGRQVLRFDGNDSLNADGMASDLAAASGLTVFIVSKQTTAGSNAYLFSTHNAAALDTEPFKFQYGSACSSNGEIILTEDSSNTYPSCENDVTSFHIYSIKIGTDGQVFKDGELVIDQSTINATLSNIGRVIIGAQHDVGPALSDYLNGDIAEVIVYSQLLNNTNRHNLEAFLAQRYGITVVQE